MTQDTESKLQPGGVIDRGGAVPSNPPPAPKAIPEPPPPPMHRAQPEREPVDPRSFPIVELVVTGGFKYTFPIIDYVETEDDYSFTPAPTPQKFKIISKVRKSDVVLFVTYNQMSQTEQVPDNG